MHELLLGVCYGGFNQRWSRGGDSFRRLLGLVLGLFDFGLGVGLNGFRFGLGHSDFVFFNQFNLYTVEPYPVIGCLLYQYNILN